MARKSLSNPDTISEFQSNNDQAPSPSNYVAFADDEVELAIELEVEGISAQNAILIADDDRLEPNENKKRNVRPVTVTIFERDPRPLGFLPLIWSGQAQRKFEGDLSRNKFYGSKSLVRPQNFRRPGRNPDIGFKACWLDDYVAPRAQGGEERKRDIDGLPRWYGPLNYSVIRFNHDRLPRNSLEFLKLAFQPLYPGDMQVWVKYREIEEKIWIESWDHHKGFKSLMGDLHSLAFGQLEQAETKCQQMERAITQFEDDVNEHVRHARLWEGRDYYLFATSGTASMCEGSGPRSWELQKTRRKSIGNLSSGGILNLQSGWEAQAGVIARFQGRKQKG